jgi:cysteinyl-tRNA synthetase
MERVWTDPVHEAGASSGAPLMLLNSLIDAKVPFVPSSGAESKNISWYTCGPTVYDSAHLGHARNYLAFDIVRRVMEDYFGYSILYVMNITDVEDKIILRARRNHLMASYLAKEGSERGRLLQDACEALRSAEQKQLSKLKEAEVELEGVDCSDASGQKRLDGLKEAVEQEKLLYSKVASALKEVEGMDASTSQEDILRVSKDSLAAYIDEVHKESVSDPEIFRQHAARFEAEFLEDMDTLNVRPPTVLTRVSEYIPEIVSYIETIVKNGLGYESNGSVYFNTQAFVAAGHTYGKLNPWAVGSALSAEGNDAGEKKHQCDFALWKAAKPGEPTWDSPWGKGRPGWHIECSAMASTIIGGTVDIHTGGEDLRFPHHDNELAQAEAFYHCDGCNQWVNYFLHSGHLGIEGLKMSKSLKNFVTIREALDIFTPRQLRLMMALNPWDRRMAYGPQVQEEVKSRESQLKNFFSNVEVAMRQACPQGSQKWLDDEITLSRACQIAAATIHSSFLDSINTRGALDACGDLIKATNVYISSRTGPDAPPPQGLLLRQVAALVTRTLSVMGLTPLTYDALGMDGHTGEAGSDNKTESILDAFCCFRDQVRNLAKNGSTSKDFLQCCDCVRDDAFVDIGVRLEDTPGGASIWKLDNPEILRKERDEKMAAVALVARKKIVSKIDNLNREITKMETLQALPSIQESLSAKYSKFDADGYPTHDAEGNILEGKPLDKSKKEVDKAKKVRLPFEKKVAELGPGFLDDLRQTVVELESQLNGN